jgi:hypothetical protein
MGKNKNKKNFQKLTDALRRRFGEVEVILPSSSAKNREKEAQGGEEKENGADAEKRAAPDESDKKDK